MTFVFCVLGFITVIRPLKILNDQIEEDKAKRFPGYYNFLCASIECSNLEFIERDISEIAGKCIVLCHKEYDVDYLNFKGHGNAVALTESQFRELEKTYGNNQYRLYKMLSGKTPKTDTEVIVLNYAYSEWEFDSSAEKKTDKTAILPEVGECITTGVVISSESLEFPIDLKWGLIVTQSTFDRIPSNGKVMMYVFPDRALDASEEEELRIIISKYAKVEEASYAETIIDTSGDEVSLTLAVELSVLLIVAVVLCEIIVISDFMKSSIGFINICSQLGLSKFGCCLLSQMSVVIYLVAAEIILFIALKTAEKSDSINFLCIGHPIDLCVLLFEFILVLISSNCIYYRLKGKECR